MLKKLQPIISVVLLACALAAGIFYLVAHHSLLKQLAHTHLTVIILVLALYTVMLGVLVIIFTATIRICHKKLGLEENVKLNIYSLLINFFVPGQGGPAYRGFYLYKRHQLRVKNYIIVTLLYYVFYAIVSVFLLLVGKLPWWQTLGALVLIAIVGLIAVRKYSESSKIRKNSLDLSLMNIAYLFLAAVLQAIVQITIYTIELHSANTHISLSQIITYTGAANLALFVALTPGAIGIREAFLIFTEHLHHISSGNIIVANVIDRSVYLVFLLILIAITLSLHIGSRLNLRKIPVNIKADES
jgi:uncharacterized membrane protein YbhN (UPF0104 family)